MDSRPPDVVEDVDRIVATALYRLVGACIIAITVLTGGGALLQADLLSGVFDDIEEPPEAFQSTDEVVSVLGNIAAAGIGALAAWWSRGRLGRAERS